MYEDYRSESVTVRLYADGVQVDEVVLSDANSWVYLWEGLPKLNENGTEIVYSVQEMNVPRYYNASVTDDGFLFTVVNSIDLDERTGVPLGARRMRGPDGRVMPARRLPRTGQLWWPVPYLALGGTAFTAVGLFKKRRRKDDEEE